MGTRDPVLEQRIHEMVNHLHLGTPCYAYQECDSTMDVARQLADEGAPEGTLVFAARQTKGRGRMGRRWESPEGGAYFSLILRPTRPPAEIPQLSLVGGLAVAETIYEQLKRASRPRRAPSRQGWSPTGVPDAAGDGAPASVSPAVSIRWPNDVLVDGKKIAGILTEGSSARDPRSTNHEPRSYVVLGIGINVTTAPRDLPETATSLLEACGGVPQAEIPSEAVRPSRGKAALTPSDPRSTIHDPLDPLALASALCRKFDRWYDVWTAQGFSPIREALRPWLSLGGIIRLTVGDSQLEGQATDVDEEGRLLVRLESGLVRTFEVGEVTLLR